MTLLKDDTRFYLLPQNLLNYKENNYSVELIYYDSAPIVYYVAILARN